MRLQLDEESLHTTLLEPGYVQATGEHSTADDMLERALYAFEMAWHHR